MKKAEVTAFLSLIFILLVTFVGSMIESASIQVAKNYRRTDAERVIECVFAEYQKELLEEYDVFALDAGYESGSYSEELLDKRLEYYGLVNSQNTIERIEFLSDGNGKGFYEQVISYMRHKYGIDFVKDKLSLTGLWESQADMALDYETVERENKEYLEGILAENETSLPTENNPISRVEELKNSPVLDLVMPEGKTVSEKAVNSYELPSAREKNRGYGDFSDKARKESVTDKLLFGEYITEHFYSAADEAGNVIDYEVEYLIAGKKSDRENLKTVVNRLILFRVVPNYLSFNGNPEKKAEAQAAALAISSILAVPALTEAVAQGILLAWAYEEALSDVKLLLSGQSIPFTENGGGKAGYEDYLQILLFLGKKEELRMRALDIIELNLQKMQGLSFFKVDLCVTKLEMECECSFRRGITYTFPVYYGYQ